MRLMAVEVGKEVGPTNEIQRFQVGSESSGGDLYRNKEHIGCRSLKGM